MNKRLEEMKVMEHKLGRELYDLFTSSIEHHADSEFIAGFIGNFLRDHHTNQQKVVGNLIRVLAAFVDQGRQHPNAIDLRNETAFRRAAYMMDGLQDQGENYHPWGMPLI